MSTTLSLHQALHIWFEQTLKKDLSCQHSDVVMPKIASSNKNMFDTVTTIHSASGKYKITFRKDLEEPDSCLVTLNVLVEQDELENQQIIIRDKNHRVLLSGFILQGEVSGWIDQLDKIDISSLSVIPKKVEGE